MQREVNREDRQEFSGDEFDPRIIVLSGGDVLFTTERGLLKWRDYGGYYQGRVAPRFIEALQRGDQVIFNERSQDVRVKFQLRGSNRAIEELPCD